MYMHLDKSVLDVVSGFCLSVPKMLLNICNICMLHDKTERSMEMEVLDKDSMDDLNYDI